MLRGQRLVLLEGWRLSGVVECTANLIQVEVLLLGMGPGGCGSLVGQQDRILGCCGGLSELDHLSLPVVLQTQVDRYTVGRPPRKVRGATGGPVYLELGVESFSPAPSPQVTTARCGRYGHNVSGSRQLSAPHLSGLCRRLAGVLGGGP